MVGLLDDRVVTYRGALLPFANVEFRNNPHSRTEWALPGLLHDPLAGMEKFGGAVMGNNTISPDEITQLAMDTAMLGSVGSVGSVPAGSLGMHVWQGGPHKYGPEGVRESLKHIGKGEGAQAYGWGRYDAGAPQVAKQYRGNLSYKDTVRQFRDALPDDADFDEVMDLVGTGHFNEYQERVLGALQADDWLGFDYPSQAISAAYRDLDAFDPSPALRDAIQNSGYFYKLDLPDEDIARYLDWDKPLSEQPESVQIALGLKRDAARDAQINKRLNEIDAEMKAKAPNADVSFDELFSGDTGDFARLQMEKSALEREINNQSVFDVLGNVSPDQVTGRWLYEELMNRNGAIDWPLDATADMRAAARGSSRQAASEALARAGIPGLKYYDGSSRTAASPKVVKADDGYDVFWGNDPRPVDRFKTKAEAEAVAAEIDGRTRNYVTWDQDVLNRMKLLERNGEPMGLLDTVE